MKNVPQIFHGEWWVPALADYNTCMMYLDPKQMMGREKKYTGTLTYYEDGDSTLELYHVPSHYHANLSGCNEVMWGVDANGHLFSLFQLDMKDEFDGDFTCTKFVVDFILVGEFVLSMDSARFKSCVVQFPYLRNWAFRDNLTCQKVAENYCHVLSDISHLQPLMDAEVEGGVRWLLRDRYIQNRTVYDLTITQSTEFVIEALDGYPIRKYLSQVGEFSQFLSVALYAEQNPSEVCFVNKDTQQKTLLLFKRDNSVDPQALTLIKFNELRLKVSSMLKIWHENYENVSPISSYLIDSLRKKKTFDVPDFLIIAQALDGYHKRFVNKKRGKDHRKYEDGIKILLKQFHDVVSVQKCHIDPIVLKDSRDKYSHLYPDDEKTTAVEGEDLYWLTEKCKILLTCCILNLVGLTNEEINLCCEKSPIQELIQSHSFEFD